ncbi:MAG: hypothetical protein GY753_08010 [Gammaproteobacteria bacterium]|nr:hypothetical protein [Gammaproteobacteria bacterium]
MAAIKNKNPFVLPERLNPAKLEDEYDHKRFKQWVSDLPIGDVSSAARALHAELGQMNHLEMSPVERFQALELLLSSIGFVLDKLRHHYISTPIPLSKKNRLVARLRLELIMRVVIGYKTVLAQFHDDTFTGYFLHKRTRVGASRRALYFLGELLQHEYSIYNADPKFVWKEIHGVYYYAVLNELIGSEAETTEGDPCGPLGIEGIYKQILLLALANPNGLLRGEVKKVNSMLSNWLPEIELLPVAEDVSTANIFMVDAQKDESPRKVEECDRAQVKIGWVLDTSKLDELLEWEINSIKGDGKEQLRPTDVVAMELLSKLRIAWGLDDITREERHKKAGIIDVTCGLGSLHQLFGGERLKHSSVADAGSPFLSADAGEVEPAITTISHDEFVIDAGSELSSVFVSESESAQEEEVELDIINFESAEEVDSRECISVNESNKGCYLTWPGEGEYKVRVGELIGVNPRESLDLSEAWSLGIIRWVRIQSHGLMGFGVELLDGEIEPIMLECWRDGDSKADVMPGFQQKGTDNVVNIITQPFYVGDKERFKLIADGQQITVVPGQILECTDAIMRFTIETDMGADDQVEEKDNKYSASEDPFTTLWDDLDIK